MTRPITNMLHLYTLSLDIVIVTFLTDINLTQPTSTRQEDGEHIALADQDKEHLILTNLLFLSPYVAQIFITQSIILYPTPHVRLDMDMGMAEFSMIHYSIIVLAKSTLC